MIRYYKSDALGKVEELTEDTFRIEFNALLNAQFPFDETYLKEISFIQIKFKCNERYWVAFTIKGD